MDLAITIKSIENMIVYRPTKQIFHSRLEAKLHFGTANYHRLIRKHHEDFLFINDDTLFANNEYVYKNSQQNKPINEKK